MRNADIARKTAETDITLSLDLDGTGQYMIDTGIGFLDHMLTLFCVHSGFDMTLTCRGDTRVDNHHSTEDIGICLGRAFKKALGDKKGMARYASLALPMDEALVLAAVDISGRGMLRFACQIRAKKIGTFDTELLEEFFRAFATNADIALHLKQLDGRNAHHIAEAAFKGTARVLREAVKVTGETLPSSKGVI